MRLRRRSRTLRIKGKPEIGAICFRMDYNRIEVMSWVLVFT